MIVLTILELSETRYILGSFELVLGLLQGYDLIFATSRARANINDLEVDIVNS